jgi:hypothetical protein
LIGVGGVLFDISKPTIIIFNIFYTIAMIVPDNINSQKRMGLIRITGKLKYALEHNVLAEVCLNIGRIVSYAVLLIASFSSSVNIYKLLLTINLGCICLYCIVVYKVEKKYAGIILKNDIMKHLREVEDDCSNYYHYKGEIQKEILEYQVDKKE